MVLLLKYETAATNFFGLKIEKQLEAAHYN